jgi:hypothetical protein
MDPQEDAMESVDEQNDELAIEARDWRTHPGAKIGAWTVELPLDHFLLSKPEGDGSELVRSLLAGLRAGLTLTPPDADDEH